MYNYQDEFSLDTIEKFLKLDLAVDGTHGGLIMGPSHDEGGIFVLIKKESCYVLEAEVEGFEFFLNLGASGYFEHSMHYFHRYTEHNTDLFDEYTPKSNIQLIDARQDFSPKFVLMNSGGFHIINKYSTKGYLDTLDKMNKAVSFRMLNSKEYAAVYLDKSEIQVNFYNELLGYLPAR